MLWDPRLATCVSFRQPRVHQFAGSCWCYSPAEAHVALWGEIAVEIRCLPCSIGGMRALGVWNHDDGGAMEDCLCSCMTDNECAEQGKQSDQDS